MALRARDLMTPELVTISPGASLADLEQLLVTHEIGGVPVVDEGRLVGVVSRSDIVRVLTAERTLAEVQLDFYREFALDPNAPSERVARELDVERERAAGMVAARLAGQHVRDAMISSVLTVDADASAQEVARTLVEHHVHRLIVTEREQPVGIVSSLDLAREVADGRLA